MVTIELGYEYPVAVVPSTVRPALLRFGNSVEMTVITLELGISNVIVGVPEYALASTIACLSEPAPASLVLVTGKVCDNSLTEKRLVTRIRMSESFLINEDFICTK
jgi:hypothetical protein